MSISELSGCTKLFFYLLELSFMVCQSFPDFLQLTPLTHQILSCFVTGNYNVSVVLQIFVSLILFIYISTWKSVFVVIILRCLFFSVQNGLKKFQMEFLICSFFFEALLSKSWKYWITMVVVMLSVIITCDISSEVNFSFEHPDDEAKLVYIRILIRCYTFIFLSFRAYIFGLSEMKKEREELEDLTELDQNIVDENQYMKRLSHFSQIERCGTMNGLDFLKDSLKSLYGRGRKSHSKDSYWSQTELAAKNVLEKIEESCKGIGRQVDDMVRFGEMRTGSYDTEEPNNDKVDLVRMVDYVVNMVTGVELVEWKKELVEFNLIMDRSKIPKYVLLNELNTSKVLMNILSNALKYTEIGHVTLSVEIRDEKPKKLNEEEEADDDASTTKKNYFYFRVVDTGVGIEPELLKTIFEPFVENNLNKESFGIGLVIAENIIDRANGSLTITSRGNNTGTTAEVYVPFTLYDQEEEEEKESEEEEEELSNDQKSIRNRRPQKLDVLLVEDNMICQQVIRKHISTFMNEEKIPYSLKVAKNGIEALEILDGPLLWKSPLIISDEDMPLMNGSQFCKQVRRSVFGRSLVIFVLSASHKCSKPGFCETHGFDGFQPKPVQFAEMRIMLNTMISLHAKKKEEREEMAELEDLEELQDEEISNGDDELEMETMLIATDAVEEGKRIMEEKVGKILSILQSKTEFSSTVTPLILFWPVITHIYTASHWDSLVGILISLFLLITTTRLQLSIETKVIVTFLRMIIPYWASQTASLNGLNYFCLVIIAAGFIESSKFVSVVFILEFIFEFVQYQKQLGNSSLKLWTYSSEDHGDLMSTVISTLQIISILFLWLGRIYRRRKICGDLAREKRTIVAKGRLSISKISHDITTPVSALVVYLEELESILEENILRRKDEDEEYDDLDITMDPNITEDMFRERKKKTNRRMRKNHKLYREVKGNYQLMVRCSLDLSTSIFNFLNFCRIVNGRVRSVTMNGVFIPKLIDDVIDQYIVLKPTKTNFSVQFDEVLHREEFRVDAYNVRMIVMNLLVNAFKHSKAKRIRVKVGFSTKPKDGLENFFEDDENMIKVTIQDDGKGIPKRIVNFTNNCEGFRFIEGNFKVTLGMGMIISKCIAESTGSEVVYHSRESSKRDRSGSMVVFRFPYYSCDDINPEDESQWNIVESSSEYSITKSLFDCEDDPRDEEKRKKIMIVKPLEEITVLCVDDQKFFTDIFVKFATKMGFVKVTAVQREDVLIREMGSKLYDILISDLNLDKTNLVKLLNVNRGKYKKPKVIVCVSAATTASDKPDFDGIFDSSLTKPLNFTDLKLTLQKYVFHKLKE